jgi:hypothetical protein
VRRLGLKVPLTYKRIFSVKLLPMMIQDELVKYPQTIEEDSSYEDDNTVKKKFIKNPLEYIMG